MRRGDRGVAAGVAAVGAGLRLWTCPCGIGLHGQLWPVADRPLPGGIRGKRTFVSCGWQASPEWHRRNSARLAMGRPEESTVLLMSAPQPHPALDAREGHRQR